MILEIFGSRSARMQDMVMEVKSIALQCRNCHVITKMAKTTSDELTRATQRLFIQFQSHAGSLSFMRAAAL
jgi:hypothetical protein